MNCDEIARLLKALAEPTRLRLVCLLSCYDGICVCELTDILNLPQYRVSRHLGVLRNLGIVTDERAGARVSYRMAAERNLVGQLVEVLLPSVAECSTCPEDAERAAKLLGQSAR